MVKFPLHVVDAEHIIFRQWDGKLPLATTRQIDSQDVVWLLAPARPQPRVKEIQIH